MTTGFPLAFPGQRIGLFGGSFDPPHEGHVRFTLEALRRFRLDRVWWLVSPSNPLKTHGPAPLERRLVAARRLMHHPRVVITGIEAELGTRFTAETLAALRARYRGVRFVWLMGADNLAEFHRWQRWPEIMETVPVGVLARPGQRLAACLSPAARRYWWARLPSEAAPVLATRRPPAWCFLDMPMNPQSSTAIRARGEWP